MDTLKIAICDDDLLFGNQARNEVKKILGNHHVEYRISIFGAGIDLLNAGFFDIIFLDIEMDRLSGIETAEKLRLLDYNSRIVFLTSHKKYVFSAFDVSASHYLLKPLDTQKLEKVLIKLTVSLFRKQSLWRYWGEKYHSTQNKMCLPLMAGWMSWKNLFRAVFFAATKATLSTLGW